jgi:hypothetical protein
MKDGIKNKSAGAPSDTSKRPTTTTTTTTTTKEKTLTRTRSGYQPLRNLLRC